MLIMDRSPPYVSHNFYIGSISWHWLDIASPSAPGSTTRTIIAWQLLFHDWFITLATALPFAWIMYKNRQRARRQIAGTCQTCGYDLRATPDRCPECGTFSVGR